MASVAQIRSDLNYWKNRVSQLKSELKDLKDRRDDIDSVRRKLQSTASDNANDVNRKISAARNKMSSGINYSAGNSQLQQLLQGKDEKSLGGDPNLTSADGCLKREYDTTVSKVSTKNSELSRAQTKVSELQRELNRAILEEMFN